MKQLPEYAERIHRLRTEELHESRDDFAKSLRVTPSAVSGWENGTYPPSAETCLRIARRAKKIEDKIWFRKQAEGDLDDMLQVAEYVLKERGAPAAPGEGIRIPLFRLTREGREDLGREVLLPADYIPHRGATVAFLIDESLAWLAFSPGDIVVLEQLATATNDPTGMLGQVALVKFKPRNERSRGRAQDFWPEGLFMGRLLCKRYRETQLDYVVTIGPYGDTESVWSGRLEEFVVGGWHHPGPPEEPIEGSPREKAQREAVAAYRRVKEIIDRQLGGPFRGGVIMPEPELNAARDDEGAARNRLFEAKQAEKLMAEEEAKALAKSKVRLYDGCEIVGRALAWFAAPGTKP